MHDATITLFNYHKATDTWHATLFENVTLTEAKGETATRDAGRTNADVIEAIIPAAADKSYGTKSYLGPKAYKRSASPEEHFTFLAETDFFMVGDHRQEPVTDDDYDEGFYHAMNDTYDEVYMISSAVFLGLLPHFEIGGR